jgi:hypothetical protein
VAYPDYVGGAWNCPPEDCGGIPGYSICSTPWPKEIDELPLKSALGRIANRRNAARTRIAKNNT